MPVCVMRVAFLKTVSVQLHRETQGTSDNGEGGLGSNLTTLPRDPFYFPITCSINHRILTVVVLCVTSPIIWEYS